MIILNAYVNFSIIRYLAQLPYIKVFKRKILERYVEIQKTNPIFQQTINLL